MKKAKYMSSDFICQTCNTKLPLPRRRSKTREKGHVKDLYCPVCKSIQKFTEIRYNDYYKNGLGEIVDE